MVDYANAPVGVTQGRELRPIHLPELPGTGIAEVQEIAGMVSAPQRARRPAGSGTLVRNARCRDYWVGRRPGTSVYMPKPDGNPVHGVLTVYLPNDIQWLLRITDQDIYGTRSSDGWHQFTSTGNPLTGTSHIRTSQLLGYLILATAHTKLIGVDLNNQTYDEIEQAPRAKFVTSFADRIVAANVLDPGFGSTTIKWSANADPFVWSALDDESAGQETLVSSPADTGDDITGLVSLRNLMLILRERSLWIATRNPVAIAPFRFEPLSVGIGCGLPYSVTKVQDAVVWADYRTSAVWMWQPGSAPRKISDVIRSDLFRDLKNFSWAEGAYDPVENEYHLGLATDEDERRIHKVWVFNFNTGQWSYDDGPEITTIGQAVELNDLVMIDELTDDIDDQVADPSDVLKPNPDGVIDDWAGPEVLGTKIFKGTAAGDVIFQSYEYNTDYNGRWFEFEWVSQNLGSFSRKRTFAGLVVGAEAEQGGEVRFCTSRDNNLWEINVSVNCVPEPGEQSLRLGATPLTGRNIYFRLRTIIGGFRMVSYAVKLRDEAFMPRDTAP